MIRLKRIEIVWKKREEIKNSGGFVRGRSFEMWKRMPKKLCRCGGWYWILSTYVTFYVLDSIYLCNILINSFMIFKV